MIEVLDTCPNGDVPDAEFHRLLGYPRDHVPSERARELAAWARRWFAEHGRPWVYLRETELTLTVDSLRLGGVEFQSRRLHGHLTRSGATRAMLVAVSAGRAGEEHARELWEAAKPDEYFFLETFAASVVEHLVGGLSGRICELADRDGLMAIPHYSPGYAGWDVAEQNRLFDVIADGVSRPFPEPLEVLSSGMLRPKKSLLGVVGLTARTVQAPAAAPPTPCDHCAFSPCRYRRAPYRHTAAPAPPPAPRLGRDSGYTINPRALQKWARERVRLDPRDDGSIVARFRFDGTTCSNLGRPLAFDYEIAIGAPDEHRVIRAAACRPAPGDEGHKFMCAYLNDPAALMAAISAEKPLLGRPLADVLGWTRTPAPSGCHCDANSRAHKWGLALEVIHYALAQQPAAAAPTPPSSAP